MTPTDPLDAMLEALVLPEASLAALGLPTEADARDRGYVRTTRRPNAPRLVALDCEMCVTTAGPEVVRVTVVDARGEVALDLRVRPSNPVLDWQTAFSGLGPGDLDGVTASLADAQRALCDLVAQDTVVVGHALQNDARALRLVHGRYVDTFELYAHARGASGGASLRHLARRHLGRVIQQGQHDSAEDARAALDLVRLRASRVLPTRDLTTPRPPPDAPLALDTLLARLRLAPSRVLDVFQFGSRVYGTAGPRSDWDFIVVTDLDAEVEEHLADGDVNAALYDRGTFQRLLDANSVWALECLFLPPAMVWKAALDLGPAFKLDHGLLRESVCGEAGFAWSKARRLFVRERDPYRAQKNVFHTLRFLHYGVQLARDGRITDYAAANHHLAAMRALDATDWPAHRARYEPEYRALKKTFTRLVPYAARHLRVHSPSPPNAITVRGTPLPYTGEGSPYRGEMRGEGHASDHPLATVRLARALGLDALCREHGLSVHRHGAFPSLVQLAYTPESPPDSPVARECRGLVLDEADDFRVVAFPYERFFNHGEPDAAALDWATARVFEKLDGSLAMLYPYAGGWHVASRGSPDGSGRMCWYSQDEPVSFAALFWEVWNALGYALPGADHPPRCYLFELVTNRHQIVVRHEDDALVLTGARDLATLAELDPVAVARAHGWRHARVVEGPRSLDAVQALADALNPVRAEGFVVCDGAFRRVKVKSPGYVRLSVALHGGGRQRLHAISPRRMLDLVRHGATGEFVAYFPEYAAQFRETAAAYEALVRHAQESYAAIAHLGPDAFGRAADAQRALDRSLPRVLFEMRRGRTPGDALRAMPLENVARLAAKLGRGSVAP